MPVSPTSIQNAERLWHQAGVYKLQSAALLALAVCANFLFVGGHDRQRALEICMLLSAATLIMPRHRVSLDWIFSGFSAKFLAIFFIFGILSSARSYAPQFAFFEVSIFFLLYLVARAVGEELARRDIPALRIVIQSVAAAGAIYTFKVFVAYCGALYLGNSLARDDFTPGFSNIRFFNHAQTPTLPLLILLCCLSSRVSRLRWLWLAVSGYWWMALLATTGRGTLMGMVAGCAVTAVLLRRKAIPYLKQIALTAIIGLLAYFVLLVAIPLLFGGDGMNAFSYAFARTAADPTSARTFLWHKALELIVQYPLLGIGPMHFAHYGQQLYMGAHPHDWILQIASEWGLPALVCLITAIGLALRVLLSTGSRIPSDDVTNQTIYAAMIVGTVAILVDGLVSGLFVMPQSQLAVALFIGCAMGWCKTVASEAPSDTSMTETRSVLRLIGIALVAAAMVGIANIWPDMLARIESKPLTASQRSANPGMDWPRLWKAGYF